MSVKEDALAVEDWRLHREEYISQRVLQLRDFADSMRRPPVGERPRKPRTIRVRQGGVWRWIEV